MKDTNLIRSIYFWIVTLFRNIRNKLKARFKKMSVLLGTDVKIQSLCGKGFLLHLLENISDLLCDLNRCRVCLGVRSFGPLAPHTPLLQLEKEGRNKCWYLQKRERDPPTHHAEEIGAESFLAAVVVSGLDAVLNDGQREAAAVRTAAARWVVGLDKRRQIALGQVRFIGIGVVSQKLQYLSTIP